MSRHSRPTPGDTYCNDCGLMDQFWPQVPICPAAPMDHVVVEMMDRDGGVFVPLDSEPYRRRTIDSKFHVEGSQIIKTSNGEPIPEDEPLFLLRARDRLAVASLQQYKSMSRMEGCNDYHFDMLDMAIEKFKAFRKDHPERMKQPSITRGM